MKEEQRIIEIVEKYTNILAEASKEIGNYIHESQEGQPDHFDRLDKSVQIGVVTIHALLKSTLNSITQFLSWTK